MPKWLALYGVALLVSVAALMQQASSAAPAPETQACAHSPCTWTVFGPQTFTRATGAPQTVNATFDVANASLPYTLTLTNQGVTSAEVSINGTPLLTQSDFNHNVSTISRPVSLQQHNTIVARLEGAPGTSFAIEIVGIDGDFPHIEYTETPPPNAAGWHAGEAVFAFTCSDATSGIAFQSPPVAVSSEGANQPVTGTCRDLAGNSTTISLVANVDTTAPSVAISSPAEGSTVAATTANVVGSVSDAVSGVAENGVTCNGVTATVDGANFTCAVTLTAGANAITVEATDRAGHTASAVVHVTSQTTIVTQHLRIIDVAPGAVPAGQTTAVRVVAQVDVDPDLLPSTVALYQADPQTQQPSPLATMYDDGTHGDALRGDNVFTVVADVTQLTPAILFLQAGASYRGGASPVFSEAARLFVQATTSAEDALTELANRIEQNDITGALQYFATSAKTTAFLNALGPVQRSRFVELLRARQLVRTNGDIRVYSSPWREADGTITPIELGVTRDPLGQWVIFSW